MQQRNDITATTTKNFNKKTHEAPCQTLRVNRSQGTEDDSSRYSSDPSGSIGNPILPTLCFRIALALQHPPCPRNQCYTRKLTLYKNKKLTRRWDSERELSLRRHRSRTTKYNRLVHKFRHRSTRLCVGTHVFTKFSEITQYNGHYVVQGH